MLLDGLDPNNVVFVKLNRGLHVSNRIRNKCYDIVWLDQEMLKQFCLYNLMD